MNTPKANDPRPSFTRIGPPAKIREYVKEGKRVGYTVEHVKDGAYQRFTICDPENGGALVMRGTTVRPGLACFTFAADYWEEPAIPPGPRTPLGLRDHLTALP